MKKLLLTSFQSLAVFTAGIFIFTAAGCVLRLALLLCRCDWSDTYGVSFLFLGVGLIISATVTVLFMDSKMNK